MTQKSRKYTREQARFREWLFPHIWELNRPQRQTIQENNNIGKTAILTYEDSEEQAVNKIFSMLAEQIELEIFQPASCPVLHFPGLEIRLLQRRVLRDGTEINLTRLEYSALVLLASNPGIVLTKAQIFEAVWNMDSDSCQSSVVNVIYNLRKKIEQDSKNPTYIKTVLGVGYKFDGKTLGNNN